LRDDVLEAKTQWAGATWSSDPKIFCRAEKRDQSKGIRKEGSEKRDPFL